MFPRPVSDDNPEYGPDNDAKHPVDQECRSPTIGMDLSNCARKGFLNDESIETLRFDLVRSVGDLSRISWPSLVRAMFFQSSDANAPGERITALIASITSFG